MPYNLNSRTGYKGNSTNCGLVAMSNLGLKIDRKGYSRKYGMYNDDIIRNIRRQTSARLWYYGEEYSKIGVKGHLTVKQFAKHFDKGLFCVFVSHHVGVIDNGKLFNLSGTDPMKRVENAYRIRRQGTSFLHWMIESIGGYNESFASFKSWLVTR